MARHVINRNKPQVNADRVSEDTPPRWNNVPFGKQALRALDYIRQPKVRRPLVEYDHALLTDYQPNITRYLPEASARRLEKIGKRKGLGDQAGNYVLTIYDQLLLDLSFHSSRLEGNTYSHEQARRLINGQLPAADRSDEETTMILNHKDAIEYLVMRVHGDTLHVALIQTLHALLSGDLVSRGSEGVIRDTDVLIGDSAYVPLPGEGEGKHRLATQLALIIEKANAITNPLERSLFLLLHVSHLQAFIDVNKRTARLACILPMIKNDYIPISFVGVDQDIYISCLMSFYETGSSEAMAEYFAYSYEMACRRFGKAAQRTEWDGFEVKYRKQRRELLARLIKYRVPGSETANFVREHLPEGVAHDDVDRFCSMIVTEVESVDFAQLAGIGVSRQEFERWRAQDIGR